jgi:hypothetical protein
VLRTLPRSRMILIQTFSPSRGQGLSKTAQFEPFAVSQAASMQFYEIERFHESVCQARSLTASAAAHSIGIK